MCRVGQSPALSRVYFDDDMPSASFGGQAAVLVSIGSFRGLRLLLLLIRLGVLGGSAGAAAGSSARDGGVRERLRSSMGRLVLWRFCKVRLARLATDKQIV
jgi:hypothetical protein